MDHCALVSLREQLGEDAYPKGAHEYLNDWAAPDKGWLRKFYKAGSDEARFDLTPATEKAIAWLVSLTERPFVGTESRLLTLFNLLEQISAGTELDSTKRLEDLRRKRDALDAQQHRPGRPGPGRCATFLSAVRAPPRIVSPHAASGRCPSLGSPGVFAGLQRGVYPPRTRTTGREHAYTKALERERRVRFQV